MRLGNGEDSRKYDGEETNGEGQAKRLDDGRRTRNTEEKTGEQGNWERVRERVRLERD